MAILRYFQKVFGGPRQGGADPEPPAIGQQPPTISAVAPFDYTDARIPDASRNRIEQVLTLIAEIEAAATGEPAWSPLLAEIRQLSEVHLPSLIQSYIDIPAAHRAEIFRKTGRSASFVLNDGLDKMTDRLRAMSLSLAQGNIDAFTRNMRFIEMRYGENQLAPD